METRNGLWESRGAHPRSGPTPLGVPREGQTFLLRSPCAYFIGGDLIAPAISYQATWKDRNDLPGWLGV